MYQVRGKSRRGAVVESHDHPRSELQHERSITSRPSHGWTQKYLKPEDSVCHSLSKHHSERRTPCRALPCGKLTLHFPVTVTQPLGFSGPRVALQGLTLHPDRRVGVAKNAQTSPQIRQISPVSSTGVLVWTSGGERKSRKRNEQEMYCGCATIGFSKLQGKTPFLTVTEGPGGAWSSQPS
ncbi:hypothetical protein VTO42DRAFT_8051 [Malbranchea cinnamomea]